MKLVLVQPELSYAADSDNLGVVTRLLEPLGPSLSPPDIVLLPEHFDMRPSRSDYERGIADLAARVGCHVVGGSHHEARDGLAVNSGVVADATGAVVGSYEKLRPYANERDRVQEGSRIGEVRLGNLNVLVLVCADFWFSDVFYRARTLPDLVLVPALSVTRKPTPDYSRALWRHLSITRAYEFGTFVGVSDWAHTPSRFGVSASGVSGFADPAATDPDLLFHPIRGRVAVHELDLGALATFRADRLSRGFFWKKPADLD